uniref:Uncharacterized protein n=1 Tax=Cucumis melo TaxID=3656 RepID=A0A9I9ED68_CUCME
MTKSGTLSTTRDGDRSLYKATKETEEEINRLIRSIDENVIYDKIKKKEDRRKMLALFAVMNDGHYRVFETMAARDNAQGHCSLNSTPRMLKNVQPSFGKIKDKPYMAKLNTTKEGSINMAEDGKHRMKRSNAKQYREVTPVSTGIWIDDLRGKVAPSNKDKENSSPEWSSFDLHLSQA